MGIQGLSGYFKRALGAAVRRPMVWTTATVTTATETRERWAVDVGGILYKAESVGLSPLTVVASLIVRIRRMGIEPIFVFDGRKQVVAKTEVVEQRRAARTAARERTAMLEEELATTPHLTEAERGEREVEIATLRAAAPTVRRDTWNEVKQLLYAAGAVGLRAVSEADDLLGWMARTGVVTAVVSGDHDMFARGVSVVLVPETADCTVWSRIELPSVLASLRLTYPQFVRACVEMGCDYSPPRWRGRSPQDAIAWARAGGDWASLPADLRAILERAEALLQGVGIEWGPSLLDERQLEKWSRGAPPREPAAMDRLFVENMWPLDWRPWL